MTEISAKTAKDIQSLTVFAKDSIPEVWRGSYYMLSLRKIIYCNILLKVTLGISFLFLLNCSPISPEILLKFHPRKIFFSQPNPLALVETIYISPKKRCGKSFCRWLLIYYIIYYIIAILLARTAENSESNVWN